MTRHWQISCGMQTPRACVVLAAIATLLLAAPAFAQDQPSMGEKPNQLAAPNGPPQPDPNQKPQPAPTPGAAGVTTVAPKIEEQPPPATPPPHWAAPLTIYAGTWSVRPEHSERPQIQTDSCQLSGTRFYECEHLVNGETIALLIFVPGDDPDHYYTQSVLPSGTALGRGDLYINGDTWVFTSKTQRESGAINYQRTTRVYSGRDKDTIRYQMERSDDGLHWVTASSGVEKRKK
jgi:hypothetical protein